MSKYDELEKLQNLLKSGALTQEEFEAEKQKIISGEKTSVEQSLDSPHFYCPKCGSSQIETKVFQENSGGTTVTETKSVYKQKGHGCLWWLFIGWWWWMVDLMLWIFLFIPRLICQLCKKKKYKGKSTSVSQTTNDIKYKTVLVCKNCGNTWNKD